MTAEQMKDEGLTVTKVVFEYMNIKLALKVHLRLTVTKVVFEY